APETMATATEPNQAAVRAPAAPTEQFTHLGTPVAAPPTAPEAHSPSRSRRRGLIWAGIVVGVAAGGYVLYPIVLTALYTVSTDDAYVNGPVTFVAPRVAGHVTAVLVDDNQRVKAGDLLVQLDKEPFQVQVDIKTSGVLAAKRELATAMAEARGLA